MAVVAAVCLAASTSACGALDRSLDDPGDDALLSDASTRAAEPTAGPLAYGTRPVDLVIEVGDADGSPALTSTGAGVCGWTADGSWRAGLGDGGLQASADGRQRQWTSLSVTSRPGPDAGAPGEDQVVFAVLRADFQQGPSSDYVRVEQEGQLLLEGSGASARFTADAVRPARQDGEELPPLTGVVVEVTCGSDEVDGG